MALTQVSTDGIKDTTIATADIADDAVTADKLANSINTEIAANTAKTTNATHTGEVTGSGALTIANDAVTGAKIADDAINSEHYTDGSIDTAHIADAQITTAKLASNISLGELAVTGDVHFNSATNAGKDVYWDESASELQLSDSTYATFGGGKDLKIFHDGSNSIIKDDGVGDLQLRAENFRVQNKEGTESCIHANANAAVELYHNNSKKFETTNTGNTSSGNLTVSAGHVYLDDVYKFKCGVGEDLNLYHDGTNSYLKNTTGALRVQGDLVQITDVAGGGGGDSMASFSSGGAVELYYDNAKKLNTTSTGVKISSGSAATLHLVSSTSSSASIEFGDTDDDDEAEIWYDNYSKKLNFRTSESSDLVFYRNGSEKTRITSDGLTFNGDTASANALDDYEEGDWSFSWSGGTVNNSGTTSGRVCKYRKVGGIVHFWFDLFQTNSNMQLAGNVQVDGLPFTPENSFHAHMSIATYQGNGGAILIKNYLNNNANIEIHDNGTVSNVRHLWGFGSYPVSN